MKMKEIMTTIKKKVKILNIIYSESKIGSLSQSVINKSQKIKHNWALCIIMFY